jgi:CheY-like chemotaxis protein
VNTKKLVLYADDDTDDKSWVSEACRVVGSSLMLEFVENGKDVLQYLHSGEELPCLIVLDLNMPELDGRQTLKSLKGNPDFEHIPVVIVTTSSSRMDKEICLRLGASLYLTKPDSHIEWQKVVQQLEPFCVPS